jgi:hypothetical protein
MKTYRLEVYGYLGQVSVHLWGRENLSWEQVQKEIQNLDKETYQIIEEAA